MTDDQLREICLHLDRRIDNLTSEVAHVGDALEELLSLLRPAFSKNGEIEITVLGRKSDG